MFFGPASGSRKCRPQSRPMGAQIHLVLHLNELSRAVGALNQKVWRVAPHNAAVVKGNRDWLGNDRGGRVKKARDCYKVPFKRALMLRSPRAQWLEADDMRAPTQWNPPQYSPECRCTQYAIVAHLSASSQLRHQTIIYNTLILFPSDDRPVHYLWNNDNAHRARHWLPGGRFFVHARRGNRQDAGNPKLRPNPRRTCERARRNRIVQTVHCADHQRTCNGMTHEPLTRRLAVAARCGLRRKVLTFPA